MAAKVNVGKKGDAAFCNPLLIIQPSGEICCLSADGCVTKVVASMRFSHKKMAEKVLFGLKEKWL